MFPTESILECTLVHGYDDHRNNISRVKYIDKRLDLISQITKFFCLKPAWYVRHHFSKTRSGKWIDKGRGDHIYNARNSWGPRTEKGSVHKTSASFGPPPPSVSIRKTPKILTYFGIHVSYES